MKRVIATAVVALAMFAGAAKAANADSAPVQSATQSATTGQQASAASNAVQIDPSNDNLSVRVLSPGTDGTVTQANNAASSATAGNTAQTAQSSNQTQAPGCGCVPGYAGQMTGAALTGDVAGVQSAADGLAPAAAAPAPAAAAPAPAAPAPAVQSADQSAATGQSATAASEATQVAPKNDNVSVRVLSPGDAGNVTQTNSAASSANAANTATPTQTAQQSQGGGGGVQSTTQQAGTLQSANAASEAKQIAPKNENISVRVLSPGNDGNVTQTNSAASSAAATNAAPVSQSSTQTGSGSCGCGGGSGTESSVQGSHIGQSADAASSATQIHPTNSNESVRILSPGTNGNVTQTNSAASSATATNTAPVTQTAMQAQGGGVESALQSSAVGQHGLAGSAADQVAPANGDGPVGIGSSGSGGNVTQSNGAASSAAATNTSPVAQTTTQNGGGVASTVQSSEIHQGAASLSEAKQIEPTNSNDPVSIGSYGGGGNVSQTNNAASSSAAANTAPVSQTAAQAPAGRESCGCGGHGIEAVGQTSSIDQGALAASGAAQLAPSNDNGPVRIGSDGSGGNVTQTNNAASSSSASNTAPVTQTGTQVGGGCGCYGTGVQALGQSNRTYQGADALSLALQAGASNASDPVRIGSAGNDGSVTQSNNAASSAAATNMAPTTQTAAQAGGGIQALAQDAFTGQHADAASAAIQLPGHERCGCGGSSGGNTAAPVRIGSYGNDGSLTQSNSAASSAAGTNNATTSQTGHQQQSGSLCGCGGHTVQALGQQAATEQWARGLSSALQLAPANTSAPVRIWSFGGGGATWQANDAASSGAGTNTAWTRQGGFQAV